MAQIASVAAITGTGKAFAVNEQGVSRELKAGDVLQKGETIRTVGDVRVELLMEDGRLMAVAPNQVLRLDENVSESDQRPTAQDSAVDAPAATADTILQALERGTDLSTELEATAAGLGGGGGADGGSSFVQLLRITEGVDSLTYDYSYTTPNLLPDLQLEPLVVPEEPAVSVGVTVGTGIGVGGDGSGLITGDIIKGAVSSVDIVEGSGGGTRAVTFLVTLDKVSSTDVTVTYTIVPGSASRPDDFNDGAITGTITIPAGYIGFSLTENIVEDTLVEGNETFTIVLSNPVGATLVNDTATVTIIDDDVSVAAQGGQGDESDGLVTLTGSLAADFGPGDTGTVSLAAVNASWDAGSNTLLAGDGSWKIVVNTNGTYTFTQLAAFTHTDTTNPDDPLVIQITATATDNMVPANSNTTTFTITVDDDGPSITVSAVAAADALVVDETNLTPNASANFADNFSNVPSYGTDGMGGVSSAYTLSITGGNATDSGLDNLAGASILLYNNAGVIEGRVGTDVYFTVGVVGSEVTLDQKIAIKHPDGTNPDDAVTLANANLIVLTRTDTITDGDGDTNTGSAFINIGQALSFEDDGPVVYVAESTRLDAAPTPTSVTGELNFSAGADGAASVNFQYANFSSTPPTGHGLQVYSADGLTPLTYQKQPIYYAVSDGNGGYVAFGSDSAYSTATTLYGVTYDTNGVVTKLFDMTLNGNGTYTMNVDFVIDQSVSRTTIDFTNSIGGGNQGDYLLGLVKVGNTVVENSTGGADNIQVTPVGTNSTGWTVNSNNGNLGVSGTTQDLKIDSGEGLKFDFKNSWNGTAFVGDKLVNNVTITMGTTQNGSANGVVVYANDVTGAHVNITTWSVTGTGVVATLETDGDGIKYLQVTGLNQGETFTVGTASGLNEVEVSYYSGSGFMLSNISYEIVGVGNPIDLSFKYTVTDGDGDAATSAIGVTIDPDANYQTGTYNVSDTTGETVYGSDDTAHTFTGSTGNDVLVGAGGADILAGGAGNDALYGGSGNDQLNGGAGNDKLYGGPGNDLLIGGQGNDILSGGTGTDTFRWNLAETGADVITDFQVGPLASGGDVLDLKDLLTGGEGTTAELLASYLHFNSPTDPNASLTISVDANGGDGGLQVNQTIRLEGVSLNSLGLGLESNSDTQIITKLLTNLQTDNT